MPKFKIPVHVLLPSDGFFEPLVKGTPTFRAGLGHAILRALGAHENLSLNASRIVINWTNKFHIANHEVTPHTKNYKKKFNHIITLESWFKKRVGPSYQSDIAAKNAICFLGDERPSYKDIFKQVWIEQQWPELCVALSDLPNK